MNTLEIIPTTSSLVLFNTESKRLEQFTPHNPDDVLVYTCGPTVYDYAHIGNLRSFVFADVLRKTLQANGYAVRSTVNFTDFGHLTDDADAGEDKILQGMNKAGLPFTLEAMRSYTERYITAYLEDVAALNITAPTNYTRASDFVATQIEMIRQLTDQGQTYETSDGIYFSIATFPTYGRLGNINLNQLQSGARVEQNTEKQHPADFALWKKGALGWESPWGRGFPGWHIECSAMALQTLGDSIDIHTGGIDHIHTHHNAEIAQSESVTGQRFASYWLHNAFITINDTKIAKSLGNSITLRDLQEQAYHPEAYRYWLLTAHYRSPINFSFAALDQAMQSLQRLKRHRYEEYASAEGEVDQTMVARFMAALNDDLDTPRAIALLWEVVRTPDLALGTKKATMEVMDTVLGIGLSKEQCDGEVDLGIVQTDTIPARITELLELREAARLAKDWTAADQARNEIETAGYTIADTADGPVVHRKDIES